MKLANHDGRLGARPRRRDRRRRRRVGRAVLARSAVDLRAMGRVPGVVGAVDADRTAGRGDAARAGAPSPAGLRHRHQLRRSRRRGRPGHPRVPAHVHEVPDLSHRAVRRRSSCPAGSSTGRSSSCSSSAGTPTRWPRATAGRTSPASPSARTSPSEIVQTRPPAPQFSLGKSFPGFGPIGPWVVTPDELADPDDLELGCTVNGEEVQKSRTVGPHLRRRRLDPSAVVGDTVAAR